MTSGQQDEAFFRERGFGLKIGFGARPALIIIDMIKAFTDPAMMLGANLDQQIAATQPLLAAARERKIPTIFSTVMYNEADLADAGIWTLKQKGVVTLKAGTDRSRSIPASISDTGTFSWLRNTPRAFSGRTSCPSSSAGRWTR